MMTTWKALNNQAPKYIKQLIQKRQQQSYHVRSNDKLLIENPASLSKNKFEDRAFLFAAPKLWNTSSDNAKIIVKLQEKLVKPHWLKSLTIVQGTAQALMNGLLKLTLHKSFLLRTYLFAYLLNIMM